MKGKILFEIVYRKKQMFHICESGATWLICICRGTKKMNLSLIYRSVSLLVTLMDIRHRSSIILCLARFLF